MIVRQLKGEDSLDEKLDVLIQSWETYSTLFSYINSPTCQVMLCDVWAFDIMNQFVDNWHSYHSLVNESNSHLIQSSENKHHDDQQNNEDEESSPTSGSSIWSTSRVLDTLREFTDRYEKTPNPTMNMSSFIFTFFISTKIIQSIFISF